MPRARWTMASCARCGSRRARYAPAPTDIAALCCSSAWRTTWLACAIRCRRSTAIRAWLQADAWLVGLDMGLAHDLFPDLLLARDEGGEFRRWPAAADRAVVGEALGYRA